MNTIFPFADFLWILQKEEYENARYIHWLSRFFFRRGFVISEKLIYTLRAKIVLSITLVTWLGSLALFIAFFPSFIYAIGGIVLWLLCIPFFVLLGNLISMPVFFFGHRLVHSRAKKLIQKHAAMRIIAVVGSYGKTTTKHFLYDLLRFHYRTQMIPGTINTTTGIAAWLMENLAPGTEVLIVEMDAYSSGEIAKSADMTPPDIVIVTTIGEQHLERFMNQEALEKALGEAVTHAKHNATIIGDTQTLGKVPSAEKQQTRLEVDTSRLTYEGHELDSSGLSASNKENLARALQAASLLKIPHTFVEDTIPKLVVPDRRQKITMVSGYEGVDDSFNITLSTARAGLAAARALADTRKKKLLVIAAGIPELGPEEKDGNEKLGTEIGRVADHVVVLRTMYASEIIQGLGEVPHTLYGRLSDFLADTARFPIEEWTVLLEPTLTDLHY